MTPYIFYFLHHETKTELAIERTSINMYVNEADLQFVIDFALNIFLAKRTIAIRSVLSATAQIELGQTFQLYYIPQRLFLQKKAKQAKPKSNVQSKINNTKRVLCTCFFFFFLTEFRIPQVIQLSSNCQNHLPHCSPKLTASSTPS